MTAENISPKAIQLDGIEIRRITTTLDWGKVLRLQASMHKEFDPDEIYEMLEKRYAKYRCLMEAGNCEWFGAFRGDRLVGDLGIVSDDQFARFQNVATHPDFRQKGICKALVNTAIQHVQEVSFLLLKLKAAV